jgi:hypothetical protein
MKHSKYIKNLMKLGALILATGWTQTLSAFTYSNANLLLVFRKDTFNDVEFDLGSVSNFLGLANGTVITVTNWNLNQVKAQYNNSLLNVKFLLAAATSSDDTVRRAWLTDVGTSDTPTDQTGSRMSQILSKITLAGNNATAGSATNSSQVWITNSTDLTSWTYAASTEGSLDPSNLGGSAPFAIEIENPATNRFVELNVSSVTPKPAAKIVGSFSLTSAGVLTFVAGPPAAALAQPQIQSITRVGNQSTVTFTTASGANYRLHYTNILGSGSLTNWPIATTTPPSIAGTGSNLSLTDTTTDSQRFYSVEAYH